MGNRLGTVLSAGVKRPVFAKHIRATVGPVKLVEINHIRLEPRKAALNRGRNRLRSDRRAVAHIHIALARVFRRQHNFAAPPRRLEPIAQNALCVALRLAAQRVHRIHLCAVPELNPMIERHIHLRMTVGLARLRSKRHRAKAHLADRNPGTAQFALFHIASPRVDCAHSASLADDVKPTARRFWSLMSTSTTSARDRTISGHFPECPSAHHNRQPARNQGHRHYRR